MTERKIDGDKGIYINIGEMPALLLGMISLSSAQSLKGTIRNFQDCTYAIFEHFHGLSHFSEMTFCGLSRLESS